MTSDNNGFTSANKLSLSALFERRDSDLSKDEGFKAEVCSGKGAPSHLDGGGLPEDPLR